MAGVAAKKQQRENNARLSMLQQALLMSAVLHLLIRLLIVRDLNLKNLHGSTRAWIVVAAVNVFSWLAYSILKKAAAAGSDLKPIKKKGENQSTVWWIENLQDVVLLSAGFNFIAIFSVKWGGWLMSLVRGPGPGHRANPSSPLQRPPSPP